MSTGTTLRRRACRARGINEGEAARKWDDPIRVFHGSHVVMAREVKDYNQKEKRKAKRNANNS